MLVAVTMSENAQFASTCVLSNFDNNRKHLDKVTPHLKWQAN